MLNGGCSCVSVLCMGRAYLLKYVSHVHSYPCTSYIYRKNRKHGIKNYGVSANDEHGRGNEKKMPHKNVDVVHRLIDDERKFASIQCLRCGEREKKKMFFILSTKIIGLCCTPLSFGNINSFECGSMVPEF